MYCTPSVADGLVILSIPNCSVPHTQQESSHMWIHALKWNRQTQRKMGNSTLIWHCNKYLHLILLFDSVVPYSFNAVAFHSLHCLYWRHSWTLLSLFNWHPCHVSLFNEPLCLHWMPFITILESDFPLIISLNLPLLNIECFVFIHSYSLNHWTCFVFSQSLFEPFIEPASSFIHSYSLNIHLLRL